MKRQIIGNPILLHEPEDPDLDEAFERQVAEAVASGAEVVVRTFAAEPRKQYSGVAVFADSGFIAVLEVANRTPDPKYGTKLGAIFHECQGTSFPVTADCDLVDDWEDD